MVWPEKSFQPCQIMPRSAAHLQWLPSRSEKSPLPLVLPHPHRHTGLLAVRPPLASFCLRTFASAVPLLTSLCSSSRYLRLHTLNTFNTSLKRHHLRLIFLIPRNGLPGALFFSRLTPDIYLIFENFFIPSFLMGTQLREILILFITSSAPRTVSGSYQVLNKSFLNDGMK